MMWMPAAGMHEALRRKIVRRRTLSVRNYSVSLINAREKKERVIDKIFITLHAICVQHTRQ